MWLLWPMCHPQIIRSRKLMQYDEDNTLQFKTIVQGSGRYH
jgi:hypothetical protein